MRQWIRYGLKNLMHEGGCHTVDTRVSVRREGVGDDGWYIVATNREEGGGCVGRTGEGQGKERWEGKVKER